jgi:hypothetical protein
MAYKYKSPFINNALAYNEELIRKNEELAEKMRGMGEGNSYLARAEAFNKAQIERNKRSVGIGSEWGKGVIERMSSFAVAPKKKIVEKYYEEPKVAEEVPRQVYQERVEPQMVTQPVEERAFEEPAKEMTAEERKKTFRFGLVAQEDILKGVAEKGAWYPVKQTAFSKYLYNDLRNKGYIQEDEFGRASVTEKGEKYLGTWKIKYEPKPAPVFEEPKFEAEEKVIGEAEGEFPEPREPTAEELAGAMRVEEEKPKVEIIRAEPSKFQQAIEREKAYFRGIAEKEKEIGKKAKAVGEKIVEAEKKVVEGAKAVGRGIQKGYRTVTGWFRRKKE